MHFRRFVAICSLILIGGVLAACGSDDDASPTATKSMPTAAAESRVTPPGADATPEAATPVADMAATPKVMSTVSATPDAVQTETPVTLVPMTGTLTLDGREQQDYTLTDEGCVGVGEWRMLKPGAQVIVRDAAGTVVDVAQLEAGDADTCAWSFALDAPASDFFSVSIPMVTEVWFSADDAAVQSGEIELTVP